MIIYFARYPGAGVGGGSDGVHTAIDGLGSNFFASDTLVGRVLAAAGTYGWHQLGCVSKHGGPSPHSLRHWMRLDDSAGGDGGELPSLADVAAGAVRGLSRDNESMQDDGDMSRIEQPLHGTPRGESSPMGGRPHHEPDGGGDGISRSESNVTASFVSDVMSSPTVLTTPQLVTRDAGLGRYRQLSDIPIPASPVAARSSVSSGRGRSRGSLLRRALQRQRGSLTDWKSLVYVHASCMYVSVY